MDRREFLLLSGTFLSLLNTIKSSPAQEKMELSFGPKTHFSYDLLKKKAKELSFSPYHIPPTISSDILQQIDYDEHGKIKFKPEYALWANGPGKFPVTFFHLGRYFQTPTRMFLVDKGDAREIIYNVDYFSMPEDSPATKLSKNIGFAGFRFQESREGTLDWKKNDWVAFLGASYFRAIGELYQYGLSARGLALNVAVHQEPEEFPLFTQFYFIPPKDQSDTITLYALLESPSVTGAFRFEITRSKAVFMDVEKTLFFKNDIKRLGIAPLTSMYWYSETRKQDSIDWRPEVHDSDGLALWTGDNERIWRPLNNPLQPIVSSFKDQNPKAFGLMQRDRNSDHYQDGVRYERRPSLWIEPKGDWGKGAIELVEIPTDDEIHDNIVAMWVPEQKIQKGDELFFSYRMGWIDQEPFPEDLARFVSLRFGRGGDAGTVRPQGVRKLVLDISGGKLRNLAHGEIPQMILSTSRGEISNIDIESIPNDIPGWWRVMFDLKVTGAEPVELRGYLRNGNEILSETWLYQYRPSN